MTLKEALALRIEPQKPGAEDIQAMNNRSVRLRALFDAFHRHDPNSDHHGCFTGLHQMTLDEMPDGL